MYHHCGWTTWGNKEKQMRQRKYPIITWRRNVAISGGLEMGGTSMETLDLV